MKICLFLMLFLKFKGGGAPPFGTYGVRPTLHPPLFPPLLCYMQPHSSSSIFISSSVSLRSFRVCQNNEPKVVFQQLIEPALSRGTTSTIITHVQGCLEMKVIDIFMDVLECNLYIYLGMTVYNRRLSMLLYTIYYHRYEGVYILQHKINPPPLHFQKHISSHQGWGSVSF